ncbi:MAG: type II toxin-antitoxin system RelE/ParE family toxin [Rhizomicrobium sp.]|jgi:proteic killer suppression protein
MILSFRHKGLARLFSTGETRGVDAQHVRKLRLILTTLNAATSPAGMDLPGFRLHPLKGDRKGQWAVSASGNWRVVFRFEGSNAADIDLIDYH